MDLVVPGDTVVIRGRVVQVAEVYLRDAQRVEVVTLDGWTLFTHPELVHYRATPAGAETGVPGACGSSATSIPSATHTVAARDGYRMVVGVEPRPGLRVYLTPASCAELRRCSWFWVSRVEAAYVPDCAWLHGCHVQTGVSARLYVTISRLHVEQPVPASG